MKEMKSDKLSWKDRVVQADLRAAQLNAKIFNFIWAYGEQRQFSNIPLFKILDEGDKEVAYEALLRRAERTYKSIWTSPNAVIYPPILEQSIIGQLNHENRITKGDILKFFYENAPKEEHRMTSPASYGSDILKYPQALVCAIWAIGKVGIVVNALSDKEATLPQMMATSLAVTLMASIHSVAFSALQKMSQSDLNGIADPDMALAQSYSRVEKRGGHLLALEMERANPNDEKLAQNF